MKELQTYRWVDNRVKIDDFYDTLPKIVRNLIDDLERFDQEENYAYFNYCESIEDVAKLYVPDGRITKEQFNKLCCRYYGG